MKVGIEVIEEPEKLDEKGRCCGRKPIVYTRGLCTPMGKPHKFCPRCGSNYSIETGVRLQ
jgi:rRNA maturation endonuclease Nob1